jgi:type VI protein secretion system component Hcp
VFKFDNVFVSSLSTGASSKGTPQEQVTFAFSKVAQTILGSGGTTKGATTLSFDLKANKAP